MPLRLIDRYFLSLSLGTLGSVVGIIMSLMVLEHIPRLIEITRLSGERGYVVGQTVLGLLPEYAGIGILVGLYLSFALAIRKLELRGELAAIEAAGIGPWRWMRVPILLTVLAAAFILTNQGWLVPLGEQRLALIGQKMARGDFGYVLPAGEFHQLGARATIHFDSIDETDSSLPASCCWITSASITPGAGFFQSPQAAKVSSGSPADRRWTGRAAPF